MYLQVMIGLKYIGWRESAVPTAFAKSARRIVQSVIEYIKPQVN